MNVIKLSEQALKNYTGCGPAVCLIQMPAAEWSLHDKDQIVLDFLPLADTLDQNELRGKIAALETRNPGVDSDSTRIARAILSCTEACEPLTRSECKAAQIPNWKDGNVKW